MYSDTCYITEPSLGGKNYFVTFTDDFSRYLIVETVARKSEVFGVFKNLMNRIENEHGMRLKNYQTDNGTEFLSNEFSQYLLDKGIHHRLSTVHTPQQMGVAEI